MKIVSLLILLSAFAAGAKEAVAEERSLASNLVGCWSTKNTHKGQPYSATYCLENNGHLNGSFTEGYDGTDFIGNWGIKPNSILEIILENDEKISCKYVMNYDGKVIYLEKCTDLLLNGRYDKS
jgi:hypothetical protein